MKRMTTGQFGLLMAVLSFAVPDVYCADTPAVQWRFDQSDCDAALKLHAVETSPETLTGHVEHIQIRAGAGTYCYFDRDIENCHVIEDFETRIRIRSNRTGISAMARIRFPNIVDPSSNASVSVLVRCDEYDQPGAWQELRIKNLTDRIQEHIRYVRHQYGRSVDESGAYIDGLVLNVFGGPGTTDVLIGEISTYGRVPIGSVTTGRETTAPRQPDQSARKFARATVDSGLLRVGESLFVPTIVEYRGEPLSFLANLGINTIALNDLPSRQFVDDAEQNDLWIICPPPSRDVIVSTRHLDRVIFWDLGMDATQSPDPSTAIEQLRLLDPRQRLLVGSADDAIVPDTLGRVTRFTDIVLLDFNSGAASDEPLVSQFDRFHKTNKSPSIVWAKINSSSPSFHQSGVEQTLAAVAAGANGIWFDSAESFSGNSPKLHLRRTTLEAANLKLQSIKPWVVGAGQRRLISSCKSPTTRVVQLITNDAGLLLLVHNDDADFGAEPIVITSPITTESSDAFQLLPTGLRPLKNRRITGGLAITLHDIDSTCPVVVTENHLATDQLARFASATRRRSVAIQKSLAEASLRFAETGSSGSNVESTRIARQLFDRGRRLLDSGDSTNAYHAFQNSRRVLYR